MKRLLLLALCVFGATGTSYAQETSTLVFVSEFVQELGAAERLRNVAETESKEKDFNSFSHAIRNSTRLQLELRTRISVLSGMRLSPRFEWIIKNMIDLYKQKIELHERLIDIASAFVAGPRPGVDFGKLAAVMPQVTASLEFIDQSIFKVTPAVFITLIDTKVDDKGHANHLIITKTERQKLIGEIDDQFGSKLKMKNPNYVVGSASVLKAYLLKDFKSSDDPW